MAQDTTPDQPNVLVVLTDQQRWDTVGAYGSPMDLTPALDDVAADGTRFEAAVTPQPLCGPARSCLQTGQYATESGCWKNGIPLPDDADHLLARRFADAGYRTGYVGKWHLADTVEEPVPAGRRAGYRDWKAADVLEFTSHPYDGTVYDEDGDPVELDGYRVDALTDLMVSALESTAEPFFRVLSHLEPHHQNDMETFVAPDGYAERHRHNPWIPPDLRDRPGDWYEELPDYYGICERIDESFGRLLGALEREGIAEDTVVVFASDHGCHFRTRPGEYKRSCHESSVRVPLVFCGPGIESDQVVESPVSLLDLPPTLLDLAGIDVPDEMQGHSLVPELTGRDGRPDGASERPDAAFVQISESQTGRALRTDRWKYAVAAPSEHGWQGGLDEPASDVYVERHLYDLRADPAERVNLVSRPEYAAVREGLRERLLARIETVEGERPDVVPFAEPGFREY